MANSKCASMANQVVFRKSRDVTFAASPWKGLRYPKAGPQFTSTPTSNSDVLTKKAKLAREHSERKLHTRRQIAAILLDKPVEARAAAMRTLENKKGRGVRWSKCLWHSILDTWSNEDIASLLTNPTPEEESLADSHPFGGTLQLRDLHSDSQIH